MRPAAIDDTLTDRTVRKCGTLIGDLDEAIAANELHLHFQPFFEISCRRLCGFEALARWTHSPRGEVPSSVFVPLAETSGRIGPLGLWVLEEACAVAQTWTEPLSIAVNLSPVQLREPGFALRVAETLCRTGLAPERLELEVTESVLIEDTEDVLRELRDLRHLGVRIALDDFGTGFSSLSYLRRFRFDKIKIDRSFVQTMCEDKVSEAIVAAVIKIGDLLNVTITGEGVESEQQLGLLQLAGCHQAQGYFLGAPSPTATVRCSA